VRTRSTTAIIVSLLLFSMGGNCHGDSNLSYDETVNLIKETMISNTSVARKERYSYINFNTCVFEYTVSGTYPVGDLYTIRFSNIDISSLNHTLSKTGHDYTAFVILNFNSPITFKDDFKELTVRSLVINTFDDEKAQLLFDAFSHLGEVCGAPKGAL